MALRFLALTFTRPGSSSQGIPAPADARAAPSAVLVLAGGVSRLGPTVSAPRSVFGLAQELQSWCEYRGIRLRMTEASTRTRRAGSRRLPALTVSAPADPATAERLGALLREFAEVRPEPIGIAVTLPSQARSAVTARLGRRTLSPLPAFAPPVWSVAAHLLRGLPYPNHSARQTVAWRR